jgi:integrase/recombinase XerD
MTHLRKMMLEELERRNYAQTTIDCYLQTVEDFARYFRRPPDQLTPEHIREYQAYLFRERKLAASTVTQRLAALRFFYTRTIRKAWSVADTPYPKKTRHLPSILSPEEVAHLIDSSRTWFHRVVLMTLYGTGVRRAELTRLQIPDINSRRMVIHIRGGKGRQDRDVMLSPTLLEALREHWRGLKRKPRLAIPRRALAHRQSSHHSQDSVLCVPTCRPASWSSEPGSSPHPAPLFRHALAGKRS